MEERNRGCDRCSCGGERSHLVVRYQLRERSIAVTKQRDETGEEKGGVYPKARKDQLEQPQPMLFRQRGER